MHKSIQFPAKKVGFQFSRKEMPVNKELDPSKLHRSTVLKKAGQAQLQTKFSKLNPKQKLKEEPFIPSPVPKEVVKPSIQTQRSEPLLRYPPKVARILPVLQMNSLETSPRPKNKAKKSLTPYEELQLRYEARATKQRAPVDYTPYTVKDYRKLNDNRYKMLGGIGPATVGSEDWKVRNAKASRVKSYSEQLRKASVGMGVSV